MVHALEFHGQYCPECSGVAEGMEERQNGKQYIVLPQAEDFIQGVNIRANITMSEHNALRATRRTRSKRYRCHVVRIDTAETEPEFQQYDGNQPRSRCGNQLIRPSDFILKILQVDHFRLKFDL